MTYLYPFLALYALWLFYLAVMNLKRASDNGGLSRPAMIFGAPIILIGFSIDVLVNLTVCTVLFVEIPQEKTVTARLTRHKFHSTGWRQAIAAWVCVNLLDKFDPSGCHCSE